MGARLKKIGSSSRFRILSLYVAKISVRRHHQNYIIEQANMGVHGDEGWSFSFENNPLWRLKLRFEHSGWLQYLPTFILASLSLILAVGNIWFLECTGSFYPGIFVFIDIRPREPIPSRKDNFTTTQAIHERHSCRSFQSRKLTEDHRHDMWHAQV